MAWVALVAAGLFETAFAVCLKLSDGLRVLWPTVGFALSALTSFGLLMLALRELEVGPAYGLDRDRRGRDGGGRHDLPRRCRLDRQAGVDRPDPGRGGRAQPVRRHVVTGLFFFRRAARRRMPSISALIAIEAPNAISSPAHGLSSNAWPPRRPIKNA